jgi:predicted DNA-binding transcriptional regulator AlpA
MKSAAPIIAIDTAQIAALLGVKRRYATDVITKEADFPQPVMDLSERMRRWDQREVLLWIQKRTQRRRGTRKVAS